MENDLSRGFCHLLSRPSERVRVTNSPLHSRRKGSKRGNKRRRGSSNRSSKDVSIKVREKGEKCTTCMTADDRVAHLGTLIKIDLKFIIVRSQGDTGLLDVNWRH